MKFNFLTRINKFQQKKIARHLQKIKDSKQKLKFAKKNCDGCAANFVFLPPLKLFFIVFFGDCRQF